MIAVSYFTSAKYSAHAKRLASSLLHLDIRHDVEKIRDLGSWQRNTHQKAEFIRRKLDQHKEEDAIVWIDADAVVRTQLTLLPKLKADLAVYRHLTTTPYHGEAWHNFGQLWNGTLMVRPTTQGIRIVEAWIRENRRNPDRWDQKNLATVLSAADAERLKCLPPEYCWVEKLMRPVLPAANPVIEHFRESMKGKGGHPSRHRPKLDTPEALWSGHIYGASGYAKANREIVLRLANSVRVRVWNDDIAKEPYVVDDYTRSRIDVHVQTAVSEKAPLVRFYTPREEAHHSSRYRICWTMMETETLHPEFTALLNAHYNEIWTPSKWNVSVMQKSGVVLPIHVMPLGVNQDIYMPGLPGKRPRAKLLTTKGRGRVEEPPGFCFVTVFQPTFRKGIHILTQAFSEAFSGRKDVSLLLVTGASKKLNDYGCTPFSWKSPGRIGAKIYHLMGYRSEREMADLYRACNAYVSTSLGEGWNLPLYEAAACKLPVIAPRNSAHSELLFLDTASLVEPDGMRAVPGAGKVSVWYDGQLFSYFGRKAITRFAEEMGEVERRGGTSYLKAAALERWLHGRYQWGHIASRVSQKIREIWK